MISAAHCRFAKICSLLAFPASFRMPGMIFCHSAKLSTGSWQLSTGFGLVVVKVEEEKLRHDLSLLHISFSFTLLVLGIDVDKGVGIYDDVGTVHDPISVSSYKKNGTPFFFPRFFFVGAETGVFFFPFFFSFFFFCMYSM